MNPIQHLWKRRAMMDDLSDEIEQHISEKIEALVAEGMPREEAVHAARRAFGNSALMEERGREFWMWSWIENLWADLKFTVRQLRKSPGFTMTAGVTLALGIGATTAIFSLFLQVLLHSLPMQDPQSLVLLRATGANTGYMSGLWRSNLLLQRAHVPRPAAAGGQGLRIDGRKRAVSRRDERRGNYSQPGRGFCHGRILRDTRVCIRHLAG